MKSWIKAACLALAWVFGTAQATPGYFRKPSVHGDVLVFTAEGDLWRTTTAGGSAVRPGGTV